MIVLFLFFIFFAYYKRDMLIRLFTLQASAPSNELHEQLNKTADTIIKRLETEISHLEYLLEEADAKSALLEKQLVTAEHMIKSLNSTEIKPDFPTKAHLNEINTEHISDQGETIPASRDSISTEKRSLVVTMAEQGYTITEIAKSTGMGKGEIMLLLHLHKK